jgi:hypothetical protein
MDEIDLFNTYSAKWTLAGWFIGLAYYDWFSATAPHLPVWINITLIVVGMFAASIIIGGGMALLLGLISKLLTRSDAFAWGAFMSPVLAFFAAKYAVQFAAAF